jgi:hypothetical protein
VNKQVDYEQYKSIMVAGFLAECKNPYFRWKNRFSSDIDLDTGNENLTPENFVASDVRSVRCKISYSGSTASSGKSIRRRSRLISLIESGTNSLTAWKK